MQRFFDAQADWTGEHNPRTIKERKAYLKNCRPQRKVLLGMMLRSVRNQRAGFAREYLKHWLDQLEPESMVGITPNLRELLVLANQRGDTRLDRQRRYEAIRFFDEARAMVELEQQDRIDYIYKDLTAMIKLLVSHLFELGSDLVTIWTGHDRNDSYRVKDFSIGVPLARDGLFIRQNAITCRFYETPHGRCVVALHHRIKEHYATLLKMVKQQREGLESPSTINDRCALKLVVPNEETALAVAKHIQQIIEDAGGIIARRKDTLTQDPDRANRHSSRFFKILSLIIVWRKRHFEIQITTFPHYYSSEFAVDEENHTIYRLLQCFDHYFPWIFPTEIYGIDWNDRQLRRDIMAFEIVRMGWRVDRRTLPISQTEEE
ncbi:MAG: hypothetical protein AAB579_02110 [Patescibacteria group bacterium]